jgi:hypothetical protein
MADRDRDPSLVPMDAERPGAPASGWRRRIWLVIALLVAALVVYHVAHGGIQRHLAP